MKMKTCKKCAEEWPADRAFFYPDKSIKDGLTGTCIACWREFHATKDRRISPPSAKPRMTDGIAPLLVTTTFFGLNLS